MLSLFPIMSKRHGGHGSIGRRYGRGRGYRHNYSGVNSILKKDLCAEHDKNVQLQTQGRGRPDEEILVKTGTACRY